jgi:hypothetical protein
LGEGALSKPDRTFGEKELLVIRIEANDSSTTSSETQLFHNIFDDDINLSKQINSCSHGKLTMKPAIGQNINNGITTIELDAVRGRSTVQLVEQIKDAAPSLFGRALNSFDHVMMCMPYGTRFVKPDGKAIDSWHAYVPGAFEYTNFLSVYNDQWCSSTSAAMHELGHNLGLDHANEDGVTYEDETGSMGFSGVNEGFAAMRCYNPAKSWQLGWYSKQSTRIDPFVDAPFQTLLKGITSEINGLDNSKNILLQIPNGQKDIYIGYNLAQDFNAGTIEGQNRVLINEQEFGLRKKSNLLAKLAVDDSYTIQNYQGSGKNLVIEVVDKILNGKQARVEVYFQNGDASNQPACGNNQVRFEVSVKTDSYAADTSWELVDDTTDAVLASRSSFQENSSHSDKICIDRNKDYTFTMYDGYADGICCTNGWGAYSVFVDGEQRFHGSDFDSASVSHTFHTKERESNTSRASCKDDQSFLYKGVRKCNWVANDTMNRCKKTWNGKTLDKYCPSACGKCNKEERSVSNSGNNVFCRDDRKFLFRDKKPCEWVAKDTKNRCGKMWRGKAVREKCKATCGLCGGKNKSPEHYDEDLPCEDDPSFRYKGTLSCKWAAGDPSERCEKEWQGALVKDSCRETCRQCSR